MFVLKTALVAAAFTLASAASAVTVPITGLFNTGVDASGSSIADNAVDTHWSLTAAPIGVTLGAAYAGASNGVFPINGPWLANTATSRWLTPTPASDALLNHAPGDYSYTLSFTISPFQLADTAEFSARLAADNGITGILLNGNALTVPGGINFNVWQNFGATSGFVAGLNSLVITANNAAGGSGNPTGVRVEFLSSSVGSVPEPQTWALLVIGFGCVGFASRRRTTTTVAA